MNVASLFLSFKSCLASFRVHVLSSLILLLLNFLPLLFSSEPSMTLTEPGSLFSFLSLSPDLLLPYLPMRSHRQRFGLVFFPLLVCSLLVVACHGIGS